MDLSVVSVWLTGEVDVGLRRGLGKLGNMSRRAMKKLGSAHCKRAVWAEVPEVGAKGERRVESVIAIAGKPAPTGFVLASEFRHDT
jgi:hypothetical protein